MSTRKHLRNLALFSLFVFISSLSTPGYAWLQDNDCTDGGARTDIYVSSTFTYNISTTDFPTTGDLYDALVDSGPYWGDGSGFPIAGTDLHIYKGTNTTIDSLSVGDGIESVTLEATLGDPSYKAEAIDTCDANDEYYECDIRFRSTIDWYSGVPHAAEASNSRSINAYFLHEVGHCLGFDHENDLEDTMNYVNPFAANIGGKASVASNSRDGVRDLYPSSTTGTDVAISILRMDADQPAGNTDYIPFQDVNTIENESPSSFGTVTRKYCLYNLGTDPLNAVYKIYISEDDNIIETTDRVLATYAPSLGATQPYCDTKIISLPLSGPNAIPSGSYYLGAIIDPNDEIEESVETNNVVKDTALFVIP